MPGTSGDRVNAYRGGGNEASVFRVEVAIAWVWSGLCDPIGVHWMHYSVFFSFLEQCREIQHCSNTFLSETDNHLYCVIYLCSCGLLQPKQCITETPPWDNFARNLRIWTWLPTLSRHLTLLSFVEGLNKRILSTEKQSWMFACHMLLFWMPCCSWVVEQQKIKRNNGEK